MTAPVKFELAKLLKEKDEIFDVTSTLDYPTITEVVMWLYEKHGIWISVEQNSFIGGGKSSFISNVKRAEYNSPTEAYEAAIEYCLTKLIHDYKEGK